MPGGWNAFEIAAVRAIRTTGFSAAATTLMGRLVRMSGSRLSGAILAFSDARAGFEISLSAVWGSEELDLRDGKAVAAFFSENEETCLTQPDVKGRLLALKGIGKWTAGYILMRTGDNQDHWPEGDLVLRKALSKSKTLIAPARLEQAFSRWSPYRSYAAIHIWRGYVPVSVSRKP